MLLTITIATLLVTVSLEVNRRVRSRVISTAAARDRMTLSRMASAGIHAAMSMLVADKLNSNVDSIQEDWANPEKISEALQDIPFEEGQLSVQISDELGKIQINALVNSVDQQFNEPQRAVWDRFLSWIVSRHDTFDDTDVVEVINSLKDWLDTGDDDAITGLTGAESDYYESLEPGYAARNGPVPYAAELLRIKGITPALFWGTEEIPGLNAYVTVYGRSGTRAASESAYSGKVNINTALLPGIIALLPPENEDLAQEIIDYRQEMSDDQYVHDLSDPDWYKEVPGLGDLQIAPDLIATASDVFRVVATAQLHSMKFTTIAVVERLQSGKTGKLRCRVLSWETD